MEQTGQTYKKYRALLKLALISAYLLSLCLLFFLFLSRFQLLQEKSSQKRQLLLSYPYTRTNVLGYGSTIEPLIKLKLKYPTGYRETKFLLDSGALTSSLPFETAPELGVNLALLPRQVFLGFGNTLTYAYRGQMTVKLGPEEVQLPVVFTENTGTKNLLGRHGFFNDYSVEFNHIKGTVDIYQ